MNEGANWGQGYNRSIRLQCRRRPNKATFNLLQKHLYTKDSKGIIYSSDITTALRLVNTIDMTSRPKAAESVNSTVTGKFTPCSEISGMRTATYNNTV
jgi:hypothetical protein